MQWNNFLCSSPPQSKLFNPNNSKSKSKNKLTQSNNRQALNNFIIANARKDTPSAGNQMQNSISSLFVRQMNKDQAYLDCMKLMLDAIIEIRDIQKQQLQCSKKTVQLLNENTIKKQKNIINKKKSSNFLIENYIHTKYKQIDKFKNDLTMLKKSRSSQKTQKKSYNIIKLLK